MQIRPRLVLAPLLALSLGACSTGRFSGHENCALAGGGVGVLGGIAVGAGSGDFTFGEFAAYSAAGAAVGAIVGYTYCTLTDTRSGRPIAVRHPPPAPR